MWTWSRLIHLTRWLIQTHTKSEKHKRRYAIHVFQNGNIPVSFTTHCSRMLFDIAGPEECLLLFTIHPDHTKFLRFIWENQLYKFLVLPNGLCCGPRKFTKLMKPPIGSFRLDGNAIAIYIDNLKSVGFTFDECVENVITSVKLFNLLRFIIHPDKYIFLSKQKITSLGFNINSQKMEITLTDTKKGKLVAVNCPIRRIKLLVM